MSEREDHDHCTRQFIELANKLKNEDYDVQIVSAAMMAASGIYATYSTAGNVGALEPSGVDKVVAMYRQNLEHIQERKKQEMQGNIS